MARGWWGKGSSNVLLCRVPEECPSEVEDLIDRCLASEPADRPSAVELVKMLTQLGISQRTLPVDHTEHH